MKPPCIPLPRRWPRLVKSALCYAVALHRLALLEVRSGFENSPDPRARLVAENDRLRELVEILQEEIRIKDARLAAISPPERPHYPPPLRFAILLLIIRAGLSIAEAARRFFVAAQTIRNWRRRLDEQGEAALVQTHSPVNEFPELVTELVHKAHDVCPRLGWRKLAGILCRAGLTISATTVGRMLKKQRPKPPAQKAQLDSKAATPLAPNESAPSGKTKRPRRITSRHPHHVWLVDMTLVPTTLGVWLPWSPFSTLFWPFCWWVVVVEDHYSRAIVGRGAFRTEPSARQLTGVLDRAVKAHGRAPRHIISDQGPQLTGHVYRGWCQRRRAKPRYGAVGQHGSCAIIERWIRSMKDECFRLILVPLSHHALLAELDAYILWYATERPHMWLDNATPHERMTGTAAACERPGFEVRARYPIAHDSPARARRRRPKGKLELCVSYVRGRKHLPIFELRDAA